MTFSDQLISAHKQAKRCYQRRLLVLSGDRDWCFNQLASTQAYLQEQSFNCAIWLGGQIPESLSDLPLNSVSPAKANGWLGTSTDFIVADLHAGFNPDALAAISGTLTGGSVMVLLTPTLDTWPNFADPDYQRMLVYPQTEESIKGRFVSWITRSLLNDSSIAVVSAVLSEDEENEPDLITQENALVNNDNSKEVNQLDDQSKLVDELVDSVRNKQPVMVVRGDRGRGKSAALGLVCSELINAVKGTYRICVTAPRPDAVQTLFKFAQKSLNSQQGEESSNSKLKLTSGDSELFFAAPDEIIRSNPDADLLIVDEAAAIPIFMLEALLDKYPQVIFASTVHGYEGTGRGFDLRFAKVLDKKAPSWKKWTLTHPIRWADNDPVENWINQAFLLDAEVPKLDVNQISSTSIFPVSQDELMSNSDLLHQVYALLIQAHYRTTPGDLRDLLDGNLNLWVQKAEFCYPTGDKTEQIVGVLLLAKEGELPEELSEEIWAGRRRPRGHLIPQYLTAQAGFVDAARLSYLRVVRIAVHPDLQSQGLGSSLLSELDHIAKNMGVDAVGAMFAASANLMSFWRQNGFQTLRLGVSRDSSSGSYTALVAKPVNSEQNSFFHEMEMDFLHQLQQQLGSVWQDLEQELLSKMIKSTPVLSISEKAFKDVESYVLAYRGLDQVRAVMALYLFRVLQQRPKVDSQHNWSLLVSYLLQGESASSVINRSELSGIKQLHSLIKEHLSDSVNNDTSKN